ncbi:hypothetical protein [Gluconobacter oxydans]|uniref:Uncharacterized protein n=1 Tax=Gluconobacter oxydans (strain 621H) TaxID=290633 RepID=Q5FNW8_GLUOX|nr:hypothetical protein [Gluconobacter oxydans]AAW61928.1 Hypothetical protein GOX2192 [Gluconobacter oxydans 621H]
MTALIATSITVTSENRRLNRVCSKLAFCPESSRKEGDVIKRWSRARKRVEALPVRSSRDLLAKARMIAADVQGFDDPETIEQFVQDVIMVLNQRRR